MRYRLYYLGLMITVEHIWSLTYFISKGWDVHPYDRIVAAPFGSVAESTLLKLCEASWCWYRSTDLPCLDEHVPSYFCTPRLVRGTLSNITSIAKKTPREMEKGKIKFIKQPETMIKLKRWSYTCSGYTSTKISLQSYMLKSDNKTHTKAVCSDIGIIRI